MLIVWDSKTGNVERFINKLSVSNIRIHSELIVDEPFALVTYTTKFGEVPGTTLQFLKSNYMNLKGVASSGNKAWGNYYGMAASKIAEMYSVPIVLKFELSGTKSDVELFLMEAKKIV
nr:class Ib ribonucleoside-diphosphate reductase assembly flavoprotein NrdI [Paenibacillus sp. NAIST15-1]